MNVILLSLGLGCLPEKLSIGSRILFVPNAGDPYDDPYFVKDDLNRLKKLGYIVEELNLTDNPSSFEQRLSDNVDALFIAGGNTFYLLSLIIKSGFDIVLKKWISSNKTYIGASAGAVILGPSIEPIVTLDDPSEAPELKSYDSLSLIDIVVLPHYGKEKYLPKYNSIIKSFKSIYNLETLKDNEALIFNNKSEFKKVKSELVFHD
ncbi:MAG: type 1 glutamine amidotransferase-like domain-containing protein [Chlorobi bacterium]|nr:type 1 glutamine amidotransferase-like domain-containing protein [Chlorobiota bacterium]